MVKLLTNNIVKPKRVFNQFIFLIISVYTFAYGHNLDKKVVFETSGLSTLNITKVSNADTIADFKKKAIHFSQLKETEKAIVYINQYIAATGDMSILNDHLFSPISETTVYQDYKSKYTVKFSFISLVYFYAGFLGLFIFVILNLKKSIDKTSTFLISLFVLFNSLFILHLSLYRINFQYYLPHTLFASTTFSFLYGPLLYFYFKRIIYGYKFKLIDALHLLPSLALLIYILPFYLMPRLDKFAVIFNQSGVLLPGTYVIIFVKILSLSIYAFLLLNMYRQHAKEINSKSKIRFMWQRNIIALYVIYLMAYLVYAAGITGVISYSPFFHFQILVMVGVVFYVAYISYEQPEIFEGKVKIIDPINLFKYKKSGLTPSLSIELKNNLLKLLNEDKIYRESGINLEMLSQELQTTRHNASQVINEHFNMNFSELMNQYRINEAAEILKNDEHKSLSIIQVAYDVGYNNKVSFNKSFKKQLLQTPSEYRRAIRS